MSRKMLVLSALFVVAPAAIFAQGGCVNSPECPTLVLGLVGAASAVFTAGRSRIRRSRAARTIN